SDVTKELSITITSIPVAPVIMINTLSNGIIGVPYSHGLSFAGTAPIVWMIVDGDMPAGFEIVGGIIMGTPTETGTYEFTVMAVNGTGSDATREMTITIEEAATEIMEIETTNTTMIIIAAVIGGGAMWFLFLKKKRDKSKQYAIVSYSHANTDAVVSELESYEKNGVRFWFDGQMTAGRGYDTQFNERLDKKKCKGIIFFISDQFLLSVPCAEEMRYFKEKYGVDNPDKFCLFVLPPEYPYDTVDKVYEKVERYVREKDDDSETQKLGYLNDHIDLYMDLTRNGKEKFVTLGNAEEYVKDSCEEGKLFDNAGIVSKKKRKKTKDP
ncbi:MAG: putative Ig domain-containing protein, partial [Methanomassiliicoccaceae archaeon]|nr:putative Ig domain-containing protein [Methanomassiliicoccaceae archaeon]